MDFVTSIRYLGTTIESNPGFTFSSAPDLQSFYRSVNSILNVIKKPDDITQMHLLFANCVPFLSYVSAVKEYPSWEMLDCNTAVNDAIRKVFSFHRWESVRELRNGFGYKSLTEIFVNAKEKFQRSLGTHVNPILSHLCRINSLD